MKTIILGKEFLTLKFKQVFENVIDIDIFTFSKSLKISKNEAKKSSYEYFKKAFSAYSHTKICVAFDPNTYYVYGYLLFITKCPEDINKEGLIRNFAVDELHRSSGIGSSLLEIVLKDMKLSGVNEARLRVASIEAFNFYKKNGFTIDGKGDEQLLQSERNITYDEDTKSIVMVKPL